MKPVEINFNFYNEEYRARFCKSEYANNGSLYVGVVTWNEEDEYWEDWGDLTVNLPGMCPEDNEAFLDTNNCAPEIIKELEKKGYIKDTGITRNSGFCTYPLYEFAKEFLESMESNGEDEQLD